MVYQLTDPMHFGTLRRGAAPLPVLEAPSPGLWPEPLLVWGVGESHWNLSNNLREVSLLLYNAGGDDCTVTHVDTSADWLEADPVRHDHLLPVGRSIPIVLRFLPYGLRAGDHRALVSVTARGGDGTWSQTLTREVTLAFPTGPLPWFERPSVRYNLGWKQRSVRIFFAAGDTCRITYGGSVLAEAEGQVHKLYPAEYGVEGKAGTKITVEVEGLPPYTIRLPGTFRVPGPLLRTQLVNLGNRPLTGHLEASEPWLTVSPDMIDLPPGKEAQLMVECFDDGSYWEQKTGAVRLLSRFDRQVLAELNVDRQIHITGPWPVLKHGKVLIPPVFIGGKSEGFAPVTNAGDQPLHLQSAVMRDPLVVLPGQTAELPIGVGPPETLNAQHVSGELIVQTNAPLPAWRSLPVAYELDVVQVHVETPEFDFGTLQFGQTDLKLVRVRRSDGRRGQLALEIPPEYNQSLELQGDWLFLRNLRPLPVTIDRSVNLIDRQLNDTVLGTIQIRGRCLVPKLGVAFPPVIRLIPGSATVVSVQIRDEGGGLQLGVVASDRDWAQVRQCGTLVDIEIRTERHEREPKTVTLTFPSNDYVQPLQTHSLVVELAVTRWMRMQDLLRRLVMPLPQFVTHLWHRIRAKGWPGS